jgi:hypothetical protein
MQIFFTGPFPPHIYDSAASQRAYDATACIKHSRDPNKNLAGDVEYAGVHATIIVNQGGTS